MIRDEVELGRLVQKSTGVSKLLRELMQPFPPGGDQAMVLERIAGIVDRILGPARCVIWLLEADDDEAAWIGCRPPAGWSRYCQAKVIQPGVYPIAGLDDGRLRRAFRKARISLVAPLPYQDEMLGWLGIGPPHSGQPYTPDQHAILAFLAAQAAAMIHTLRLKTKLETSLGRLRQAYRQLIQVRETERRRLAETLHDETLQHLADLSVRLGLVRSQEQINRADLADLQTRLASADRYLRDLVRGVHPAVLSDLGLIEAVIAFLEALPDQDHQGWPVRVTFMVTGFDEQQRLSDPDLELALYRFTQNAVRNALKHAQAHDIAVEFVWGSTSVVVTVEDDGVGTTATIEEAVRAGHFGLLTMLERIEAFGGKFEWSSQVGQGTQVTASVPVTRPAPAFNETARYAIELASSSTR